jgi:hypothetical protein
MDSWPPVPPYVKLFAANSQFAPPNPPVSHFFFFFFFSSLRVART